MNVTTAATAATTSTQPAPVPIGSSGPGATSSQPPTLAGAGVGTTEAVWPVRRADTAVMVPLDAFARRAGPDASIKTEAGTVMVHAVFALDPTTKEMVVSVVDETGKLIRMIPPDSVAKMIAAMAAYRGR